MRIGLDATALPGRPYGAANYILNLFDALIAEDGNHEWSLFVKPSQRGWFSAAARERVVEARLSSRYLRLVWEQLSLPALTRQRGLDLLHSPHYTIPLRASCTCVATFHDMTFFLFPEVHERYKVLFFRAMMRAAARRADAIIVPSLSTGADVRRLLGIPAERVHCVPYGISGMFQPVVSAQERAAIRKKYFLPERFLLYVGNLEPRKNLRRLVRAFAGTAEPVYLVLAGSRGWKDAEVFQEVRRLGLEGRVLFPGFIPQTDLPAVYSTCEVFLYPSLYEGFGLPVLEAMACGAAVITSNISSMPEVAGNGAFLVNPESEDALADAMRELLENRQAREELADRGVRRASEFSWKKAAEGTQSVYRCVTGGMGTR